MDNELERFVKDWNIKYNLKEALEVLEFTKQNDNYFIKETEEKNIHVKFEKDEFIIWSSDNSSKKYTKYYNSLRGDKSRGFYDEKGYLENVITLLYKGEE